MLFVCLLLVVVCLLFICCFVLLFVVVSLLLFVVCVVCLFVSVVRYVLNKQLGPP